MYELLWLNCPRIAGQDAHPIAAVPHPATREAPERHCRVFRALRTLLARTTQWSLLADMGLAKLGKHE
ncbi:hypothetical protein CUJ88_45940 (plasmid) [Paraburkholderia hospita]|nr:hypothetical protein CUJ88_45940 [Paraburkholderia hospita]